MKIPKTIKIGAHQVNVKIEHTDFELTECGLSNYSKGIILLDGSLPQTQLEATLIHEIMHYMNSTIDHALLDSLSQQFYAVLKENDLLK